MLIEFAMTNFRSFHQKQTFSLLPSGKIKQRTISPLKALNYPNLQILPTAVLYGANNAGKSNFITAIRALKWLISESGNFNSDKKLDANEFFWFDKETKHQATTFEIDFIAPNQKWYNYVLTFSNTSVLNEALYVYTITQTGKKTVNTLFERNNQDIKFTALKGVRESITFSANQLFLSRGDIAGNKELQAVYAFFAIHLPILQLTETEYTNFLANKFAQFVTESTQNEQIKPLIEKILQETNTGILAIEGYTTDTNNIQFAENTPQNIKDKILEQLKYQIRTRHKLFDGKEEVGTDTLPLSEQSIGTRKLLGLLPLIVSTLEDGDTLLIDEMNTSIHTEITTWLIDLFNNPETNPNKAQLIITTHDIVLLDKQLYEKDQIFVVNKNKYGASELYSFANITGLPDNRLFDYYETGRLGGIPHIAKPYLEHLISQFLNNAKTVIS